MDSTLVILSGYPDFTVWVPFCEGTLQYSILV